MTIDISELPTDARSDIHDYRHIVDLSFHNHMMSKCVEPIYLIIINDYQLHVTIISRHEQPINSIIMVR